MKMIEQSFNIIKNENLLRHIEKAGRICYKSEEKITDTSAEKFVKVLINNGHHAMLEHSNIIIETSHATFYDIKHLDLEDIRYMQMTSNRRYLISGSIRAWRNLYLSIEAFQIIKIFVGSVLLLEPACCEDLHIDIEPLAHIKRIYEASLTYYEHLLHHNISIKFITDRAVANEFVRHRNCAFAQESTHFIDYLKRGELTYIWQAETKSRVLFEVLLKTNETAYGIASAESKKVRRGLLPLCLKTELIITTNIKEWQCILGLRTTMKAHPQMRALMRSVLDWFKEELPIFVEDINYGKA